MCHLCLNTPGSMIMKNLCNPLTASDLKRIKKKKIKGALISQRIKLHIFTFPFCSVTSSPAAPQACVTAFWFHFTQEIRIKAPPEAARDILQRSLCNLEVKPVSR